MENAGISAAAMASAERWLNSARINAKAGSYDTAIYSLEMSVEIALKALLLALGTDVPKSHAIGDLVLESVQGNRRLPKELVENAGSIVRLFNSLVSLRPVSGYAFETKSGLKELRARYERHVGEAENAVELCGKAVSSILGA
jgi:HEPN domain-containing protein